jgi:hypothetical protein
MPAMFASHTLEVLMKADTERPKPSRIVLVAGVDLSDVSESMVVDGCRFGAAVARQGDDLVRLGFKCPTTALLFGDFHRIGTPRKSGIVSIRLS